MSKPKIAVVFYSSFGTNHRMATIAAEAASGAGAEVRLRRCAETAPASVVESNEDWKKQAEKMKSIDEVSPEDMKWADGYFFSAPTRFGVVASQLRAFIDTLGPLWQSGDLANKVATATTSAQNPHGGQETTLLSLYVTLMHWGTIIVPPGYTDPVLFESGGNPYGYSATPGELDDPGRKAIVHQAKRLVDYAGKLVG